MNGLIRKLDNLTIHNNPNSKWVRFRGTPCRYSKHKSSMKKKLKTNSTTLLTHFWKEKDQEKRAQSGMENFGKIHPLI